MKRIPPVVRHPLSLAPLALLLSLAACGGGDGAAEPPTVTLEGQVIKGPVVGATVVAYRVGANGQPGAELARTTSAAGGSYRLVVPAEATTVLVQASGGTYDHEAIDGVDSTTLDTPLRSWAMLTAGASSRRTVHLTPLTETAVRRALAASGGATAANLTAAASAVAIEAELRDTDLVTTTPVLSGSTNAYGQAVLRLARLMLHAGSLESILAVYAQAVPSDQAVLATTALPSGFSATALNGTHWRSECKPGSGIASDASGNVFNYQSRVETASYDSTGTDHEYLVSTETGYFSDAACTQPVAMVSESYEADIRSARVRFNNLVKLADGSSAYRYTRTVVTGSTGAQREHSGLLKLEGSGSSQRLVRADGYSEALGVNFSLTTGFSMASGSEVPEAYRASSALSTAWYQACVTSTGTATVPEWSASYNYRSYRRGVFLETMGGETPLLYIYQTTTAYYNDESCQAAVLLDGARGDARLTLESWVTLADGSLAVRGSNVTTVIDSSGNSSVTRNKVLLRLNSRDGVNTLDAAASTAGAIAYPEGSSLRRHTVGWQPADSPR